MQRVVLNSYFSSKICESHWEIIKAGVPQDSAMGHLLFLIYKQIISKTCSFVFQSILFTGNTITTAENKKGTLEEASNYTLHNILH